MAGKMKSALLGLGFMALGAMGGTAASVYAAPSGPELAESASEREEARPDSRRGKGRAMKHAILQLDLTETQRVSIDSILEQARSNRGERPERSSSMPFSTAFVDRAAAHAALEERQERARQRLDVRLDILEVLTPEQREELARRAAHSHRSR